MIRDINLNLDCCDIDLVAGFWKAALGYVEVASLAQYRVLAAPAQPEGPGVLPGLILQQVGERPPETKNRLHLDLIVGPGFETEAGRLEALGARRLSEVFHEAGTAWIVMADPEGNEFCLGEH